MNIHENIYVEKVFDYLFIGKNKQGLNIHVQLARLSVNTGMPMKKQLSVGKESVF